MFKAYCLGLAIVTLVTSAVLADNKGEFIPTLDPIVKTDDFRIEFHGVGQMVFESRGGNNNFSLTNFRPNLKIETKDHFGIFIEIEAMKADQQGSNWLRQAFIYKNFDNGWSVRVGRQFAAAPYYTQPPLFALETVRFPREPYSYYMYGIQVEGPLSQDKTWSLIADIGGSSDEAFDSDHCFTRLEFSGRINKQWNKEIATGFVWQVSPDFSRTGVTFEWNPSSVVNVHGEVYFAKNEDERAFVGGYVIGNWDVHKNVRAHLQFDFSDRDGNDAWIITPGIDIHIGKNLHWITDVEIHPNDSSRTAVLSGLKFLF